MSNIFSVYCVFLWQTVFKDVHQMLLWDRGKKSTFFWRETLRIRAVQYSAWLMESTSNVASIWTMPGQRLHVEATAQVGSTEN